MERPHALQEKVFQHLFEAAEIAKFDRKERYEYEESLKNYRDWLSVMQTAELRGEKRANLVTARNLKQMGLSVTDIAKATGLTPEEIEKL